jgi:hypothetical protein
MLVEILRSLRGAYLMELDYDQIYEWVRAEIDSTRSVAESMFALIDLCEAACPHSDWARLRDLPYGDLTQLSKWIQEPFREEPPEVPLRGLWFGLFNPCPDGRTPVADIYVCGSKRFDPDPTSNNWAVSPEWWPESRYAMSSVLAEIYRIAYRQDVRAAERKGCLSNDAELPLVLAYGALAVRDLIGQFEPSLFLGDSESIGVAVGFDSGGFVLVGELSDRGLMRFDPNAKLPDLSIEPILEGLRSSNRRTIFLALSELPRFGERARVCVPELLRLICVDDTLLRGMVVMMIGTIAADDPRVKAAIFRTLEDRSPTVRRDALQSLINCKDLSADDLARIKNMENDADANVADWSKIALRNIRLRKEGAESDAKDSME